jgi:uncharacterized damage-inducible protein DinB
VTTDLRYPIGKFDRLESSLTDAQRRTMIGQIADVPSRLTTAVAGLNDAQLDTPYRPGGWTVRQLAHHIPESHMNAYIRFKLALTEDEPTIKTYEESLWAELPDAKTLPIEPSLRLLENLHHRWVACLHAISAEQWNRKLRHPEMGLMSLDQMLALYSWHGRHHVAHITSLRERNAWH